MAGQRTVAAGAPGEDPSGGLAPGRVVWLVDGDDPVLVADRARALVHDLLEGADPALAVEESRGDEVDLAAVADACRTPPLLADRRVVVLREVGRFSTEDLAPILEYLESPSPTASLVLVAGGGRPAAKLVASVKAHGHVVATAVSNREAHGWIKQRVRESSLHLDARAEALVESHLGEDISRLTALLDVLVSAHGTGARLGAGDVEPYLGEAGSVAPWDLTDAIHGGRTEAALSALGRLLAAGERHPLVVLAIVHRHVSSMLKVDDPDVRSEAQAAEAMGIAKGRSTFPAKKALAGARRLGSAGVAQAIGYVADAEVALKGGSEWPPGLVLEVLVARLCRLARAGTRR
ncbi:MAG TPA: DNA polymerase III subunit delta [Acidimicrobiales bacterium]|jgi:DNA polymerase-3 subunit delta|nr:DNA polymerase III subunit delta [Acidimicrobiales bacterium]